MLKFFSIMRIQIMGVCICVAFFLGQTYLTVVDGFTLTLAPFVGHPDVYNYVKHALWDLWLSMLIWPLLFLMLMFMSLSRTKREQAARSEKIT